MNRRDTAIEFNNANDTTLVNGSLHIIGTLNQTHDYDNDFFFHDIYINNTDQRLKTSNKTFPSEDYDVNRDNVHVHDISHKNMTNQLVHGNNYHNLSENFEDISKILSINSSKVFTSTPLTTSSFSTIPFVSPSTMTSLTPNTTMDSPIPTFSHTVPPFLDSEEEYYLCLNSPENYDPITATICATLLVFGILYVLYGYKCFKAVLFITGFVFATTIIYMICLTENLMPMYGNIAVSVVAGFLFGLITMLVAYVGLFMLGFHLGLLMAVAALIVIYMSAPVLDWIMVPRSVWMIFAIFMGFGLTGACGTLYFQKGCTILATVLYGSTLTLICVDYFIENFKILLWLRDKMRDGAGDGDTMDVTRSSMMTQSTTLCTISWILLGLWPVSVIIGLLVQWCITSKGIGYENDYNYGVVTSSVAGLSGVHTVNSHRNRNDDSRLEQRQRKYRYLYQVRTAHGDVISQHYIQSLNKKVCPDDSLTFNSDLSSHLTVIPDSRTTTMSVA